MTEIRDMKVTVHGVTELWERGPFKIVEYHTEHERFRGGDPVDFKWMVFERGHAVAVVVYLKDTREVVLTHQFRAPTLHLGRNNNPLNDGFLTEVIAGMPKPSESFEDCAVREVWEETGFRISTSDLEKISQFYVSPGGTSEVIHLYIAPVSSDCFDENWPGSHVAAEPHEDILPVRVPVSKFLDPAKGNETVDSKILIAQLLLRDRLRAAVAAGLAEVSQAEPTRFAVTGSGTQIVLRPGNLRHIRDVDVWVNPETTDMQMDRYSGGTVSSLIRYLGAEKYENDVIAEDTIANALVRAKRGVRNSNIGTVHVTTSGDLAKSHNVMRLFHVATVKSTPGIANYEESANPEEVQLATERALAKVQDENSGFMRKVYTSVLLPMLGAGSKGLTVETAFPAILDGVLAFLSQHSRTRIEEIHLSAFTTNEAHVAFDILSEHPRLRKIG